MKKLHVTKKRQSKSVHAPKQKSQREEPVPVTVQMNITEQQELRKRLFSSPTRPPIIGKSVVSTSPTVLKSIVVEPILTESTCESRQEIDPEESKSKGSHNKQWEIALVQSTKVAEQTLQRVMRSYQKRSAIMGGASKRALSGIPYIFDTVTRNPTAHTSSSSSPYPVHTEQNHPSSSPSPPSSSQQKPPSRPINSSTKGMSPLKNRILEKSNGTTAAKVLSDKANAIGALEDDNVSEISSIQSFSAVVTVGTATAIPFDEPIGLLPAQPTTTTQQATVETIVQETTMNDVKSENSADADGKIPNEIVQMPEDCGLPLPDDDEHDIPEAKEEEKKKEVEKVQEEITSLPPADLESHVTDINPASHSSSSSSSSSSSKSSKSGKSNEKEMPDPDPDPSESFPVIERITTSTEEADADEESDGSIAIDNRFISKLNNKYEEFRSFKD